MIKPVEDLPSLSHKLGGGCWQRDIREFLEGDAAVMEVVVPDGRTPENVANTIRMTIKNGNYPCRATRRRNRVFLVRTEDAD